MSALFDGIESHPLECIVSYLTIDGLMIRLSFILGLDFSNRWLNIDVFIGIQIDLFRGLPGIWTVLCNFLHLKIAVNGHHGHIHFGGKVEMWNLFHRMCIDNCFGRYTIAQHLCDFTLGCTIKTSAQCGKDLHRYGIIVTFDRYKNNWIMSQCVITLYEIKIKWNSKIGQSITLYSKKRYEGITFTVLCVCQIFLPRAKVC